MYEAEVNNTFESIETLPRTIRERFAEFRKQITARTTLPWGEHCTECVWPVCYTTCELYSPRTDGACRQFIDGMVRIDHAEGLNPYILKLRFKSWAKLWTVGNLHLQSLPEAEKHERLNIAAGALSRNSPLPPSIKSRLLRKVSYIRRRGAESAKPSEPPPDAFMLECYNPNKRNVSITLTVRGSGTEPHAFQALVPAISGYNRVRIAFSDISRTVDLRSPFEVEIVPNDCADTVLYFGLMDFVKEAASTILDQSATISTPTAAGDSKKWKCIVWDLDNTLWDGTLIEDGQSGLRLRREVVGVIEEMDRRGILNSIVSKNNREDALAVLEANKLTEYFLYPQISWQPKSEGIAQIAALLNIGIDTLAFVDDQPFERAEVHAALPQVAILDAANAPDIPNRPECQVPVTTESRNRRLMYREQENRDLALKSFGADYLAFLRQCHLEVHIGALDDSNLQRVYELAQRTNQMNFSGNRYNESHLRELATTPRFETYVIDCCDKFGEYGIVGFALVDTAEPRLLDLMFSCRIQAKRVEHAVLSFLLTRFVRNRERDFFANFRKTAKNAPSGEVFTQLGFEPLDENDGITSLVFRRDRAIPDDHIVLIHSDLSTKS